ncbi:MAG: PKD domain-containing protein [Bacteroidales bacterium]|nr:PKD domain-containing protein [Bacteroidales bacterium]
MKKFLLSMIAIFAMTICGFAQMEVCSDACAPHANAADYSTGVIPTYPTTFPVLVVGQEVDQCVSIQIPSEINGGAINSALNNVTITVNSITANELVNLPDGLTACISENPMAANGTYTLRITGSPTQEAVGNHELKLKANIDGESSSWLVSMTVVNGYLNGMGAATNITITVVEEGQEAAPIANITSDPATSTGGLTDWTQAIRIAQGETVSYTSSSSNTDHVAWTFEGGSPATSTANTATVTYANTGTFTTTLVAYSESGELRDTATVSVVVSEAPVVFNVDFAADNTTVLVGQTVNFTNNVTATQNGQPYTGEIFYSWSFDADGGTAGMLATSSEANPSYSYTTAGVYSVKLAVATSQIGIYMTADTLVKHAYITVQEDDLAVIADFTTTPEATSSILTGASVNIMVGESIVYTSACNENTTSIEWTFQGGDPATSTDDQVTVTYAAAGSYTTTLVAYGEGGRQSTKTLNVNVSEPTVEASFTTDPAYTDLYIYQMLAIETGTTVTYTSTCNSYTDHIAWTFEGGDPTTSTEDVVAVTYTTAGSFTTTLIAYNTDESQTDTVTLSVTVTESGVAVDENAISEISVYPNPTSSIINIAAEGMQNITIIDMAGRVVMSKDVNSNFETISAEGFAKANYMVRITTADGVVVKNIVVE